MEKAGPEVIGVHDQNLDGLDVSNIDTLESARESVWALNKQLELWRSVLTDAERGLKERQEIPSIFWIREIFNLKNMISKRELLIEKVRERARELSGGE